MLDNWIANVVGRMHVAGITGQQLAKECGYNPAYLSMRSEERRVGKECGS